MDDQTSESRMVTESIKNNADALNLELSWFATVLDNRIKIYFGHESEYPNLNDIIPPTHDEETSTIGYFINHYSMTFEERLIFILTLVPHLKPQLLDVFFTKNNNNERDFTEFGRRDGYAYTGFLPTAETALFILAGDNIEERLSLYHIFDSSHYFYRHNIITLEGTESKEPYLNGFLNISSEVIDFVTTGMVREPLFGMEFPAKKISTEREWQDLVLDPFTMEQILEIKAWIDYGHILLEDLELNKKIAPGFRALFYGAPGTGKTFTASLLGKVTNRDVFRIDLSMIISKYIGETEKNLEKVFRKAENKEWILFFDEADALFGKRTNVNDAHDRFANQEVSYLLQRVEDYSGVVILASNMKSNLDEAFTRRFQTVIHFPMPSVNERLLIWQNAFSNKTTLHEEIDLKNIAETFELSGGAIMNVIRYATLMTLRNDSKLIMKKDLIAGIRREIKKEGRTG
jgi:hypothetical protein